MTVEITLFDGNFLLLSKKNKMMNDRDKRFIIFYFSIDLFWHFQWAYRAIYTRAAYHRSISMSINILVWSGYYFVIVSFFLVCSSSLTIYLLFLIFFSWECSSNLWSNIYEILIYYFSYVFNWMSKHDWYNVLIWTYL